ncbi:cell envelope integrity EipB family protein [Hoeflea sp.]|uniref:cell envelope integrity EipB family protein n=1 Tax=Hoeflea sp. TaxID=1940281 RepID=UPI003748098C
MRKLAIVLAALVSTGSLMTVAKAGTAMLATHRAVYDLTLKSASERSGISEMAGRMVYEFNGSACEGYTVSFRFVSEISSGEDSRVTDQQTTTFEDVRDRTFRFVTRSFVNQQLDREIRGSATPNGDQLSITLEQPEKMALDIPDAKLPTEHLLEMIERAKAGERFYESRIYDGSDDGDSAMITTSILGASQAPKASDTEAKAAGELAGNNFWPVSMSYFQEDVEGDGLPVYSIAFKLYDNGVTRDLTMDYGDFVLEGELTQLDMFEPSSCAE